MIFIIFIALMLFGSDKIPAIARTLGKGMAQLKNATNEIKNEIHKSAEEHGVNESIKDLTSSFKTEVDHIKGGLDQNLAHPLDKMKEDIEEATGPIKRQM